MAGSANAKMHECNCFAQRSSTDEKPDTSHSCSYRHKVQKRCSVCRKVPIHSRHYFGHLFCIECFHKYIWNPTSNLTMLPTESRE